MTLGEGSVDEIVKYIDLRLDATMIRREMKRIEKLQVRREIFRACRGSFRARDGVVISTNVSSAIARRPSFKVNVYGVACGEVRFAAPDRPTPHFFVGDRVSNRLACAWQGQQGIPWRDPCVRGYLQRAREIASQQFSRREALVQDRLLLEMVKPNKTPHDVLFDYRPVEFSGIPIQVPMPIAPRGNQGGDSGNLDVLARRKGGTISVFEIKRTTASDAGKALDQATWYAIQIHLIMSDQQRREAYWSFLGSQRTTHAPRLEAVAFVHDDQNARKVLDEARNRLRRDNSIGLELKVILFEWKDGIGSDWVLKVHD